jgi:hypothetical protein
MLFPLPCLTFASIHPPSLPCQFAKKIGVRKDPKKQIKVTQFQWAVSELQTKKVKGLPALNSSPSAVRR